MLSYESENLERGRRLHRIGLIMLGSGFASGFVLGSVDSALEFAWVGRVVSLVLFLFGAFLLYRSKQYSSLASAQSEVDEDRQRVVYLRAFARDQSTAGAIFGALLDVRLFTGVASEEEQLAEAMDTIGPLVAIGRPGEHLPTPGAAHVYADNAERGASVDDLLSKARLVIVRPGFTPGVQWELEQTDPRQNWSR